MIETILVSHINSGIVYPKKVEVIDGFIQITKEKKPLN